MFKGRLMPKGRMIWGAPPQIILQSRMIEGGAEGRGSGTRVEDDRGEGVGGGMPKG